jgi:hypothetical protein
MKKIVGIAQCFVAASLAAAGCKGKASKVAAEKATGSAAVTKPVVPPAPKLAHVTASSVTLTSCGIGAKSPEGDNGIGAARGLHQAMDGTLYFFADYAPPQRLDKIDSGCGYALAPTEAEKKDHDWGLDPDGKFTQYPFTDESAKTKCRVKAFTELRYGSGALVAGKFYVKGRDSDLGEKTVVVRDLSDNKCEPKAATLSVNPDGTPDVSGTPTDLFVTVTAPGGDLYNKNVFRYDAAGTLIKKYGGSTTPTKIERVDKVSTCGDGLCITESGSSLDIFDTNGALLKSLNTYKLFDKKDLQVQGVTEVPGKGVYVLIGYKEGKGHAELLRVDGL